MNRGADSTDIARRAYDRALADLWNYYGIDKQFVTMGDIHDCMHKNPYVETPEVAR